MIVNRLGHWRASKTKDIFMPFDSAFFLTLLNLESPTHDAAVHGACLHIALINEALAQAQAADRPLALSYAASPAGELVHLITQGASSSPLFWKISGEATPHPYSLRFLDSIHRKEKGRALMLSSTERAFKLGGVQVLPWESVL